MSKLGKIAADALSLPWLAGRERSVIRHIADCRTERMGANSFECDCGHLEIHYNSCRDRHCPLCQGAARARWVADRLDELLPCGYFHVVFTLPHELAYLALANKTSFYRTMFQSVHETLLTVCRNPENLGARIGGLSVLHTWNQKLAFHPHIHCIVPGGGVSTDGERWIAGNHNYLVSVKRLSAVFRGKLLSSLEKLLHNNKLHGNAAAIRKALSKAAAKQFVVYAKKPFGSPAQVLKYLGRYTHRVGISEQRIVSYHDGCVRFGWIDRANGHVGKTMNLSLEAFAGKFLLHILPKGLRKIRYFGYMGNRNRNQSIAKVRSLIIASGLQCNAPASETALPDDVKGIETPEPGKRSCPKCGLLMHKHCSNDDQKSAGWLERRLGFLSQLHGPDPGGTVVA